MVCGKWEDLRGSRRHHRIKEKGKGKELMDFEERNRIKIQQMAEDTLLRHLTHQWFVASSRHEYSYHFSWLGCPIIQYPQDILATQEIVWRIRPDLIIETGIARGGSLIFYASLLELIGGDGSVLGIDIDIREHNRVEIQKHPMFKRIQMIEDSSTDEAVIRQVRDAVRGKTRVMVALDSNHTHDHVLKELEIYSPFVSKGSYLIVFDTIIEHMPDDFSLDRPWGKGNNPATALSEFLQTNDRFVVDREIENKLLITVAPHGYLKCVKD
jgi:cephalosporin hydroxylase